MVRKTTILLKGRPISGLKGEGRPKGDFKSDSIVYATARVKKAKIVTGRALQRFGGFIK